MVNGREGGMMEGMVKGRMGFVDQRTNNAERSGC